jgi:hypothetical protein
MPYVTPDDVAARIGRPLTAAEAEQVAVWEADLVALVEAKGVDLAARIASGALSAAVVTAVFASAIIRVLRNPKGLRQRTESIDDYSITETVDTTASAGAIYLSDDEWDLLAPGSTGEAFTIRSYGEPGHRYGAWVHPDQWVPYS